jgi:glycosyltransferase involved in cell wall biosynthesis
METASSKDRPQVSAIIPVYRNAATLLELHQRLSLVLQSSRQTYEILFIDDACPEDSLNTLEQLAGADAHVGVIALQRNHGQQQAVLQGLACANGQSAVILDADLQDPPEAIPNLLEQLSHGYSIAFAGRRGQYEATHRLLTSRLFKTLLHWVTGVPRDAGIFMALDRQAIDRMLTFYAPQPFIVAMAGCSGLPMTSIPVERSARPRGESAYSSWKRLKTGMLAVYWAVRWKYHLGIPDRPTLSEEAECQARFGGPFTPHQ